LPNIDHYVNLNQVSRFASMQDLFIDVSFVSIFWFSMSQEEQLGWSQQAQT